MKHIKFPVYFTTIYLVIYTLLAQYEATQFLVPWLFVISPFVVLWMVYRVLKYGVESKKTFEEAFYEDVAKK